MPSILEKAVLAALGAFSLTKERAEKMIKELIKEGEMSKSEAAKFAKDLIARTEKTQKELVTLVEKAVKRVIKELDIPTRAELKELRRKVERVARKKK